MIPAYLKKSARTLASLKVAIPLLVLLTAVTVIGSLFPQPDFFRTWWYLGLLGVLGISLLLITVLHIPRILRRKGRNALIGVITTHAGILVLIVAAIYGGVDAKRWQFRAIEGEMTVVPGMPFVVELASLEVEEYAQTDFPGRNLGQLPKKRQDSLVRLHQGGEPVSEFTAAPGRPGRHDGYTLLPSISDIGWAFDLIVTDRMRREQTFTVRPWAPPIIELENLQVMAHPLEVEGRREAQIFTMVDQSPQLLGRVAQDTPLELDDYTIRLGGFKRYTSLSLYNRPHMPLLVFGVGMMLAGLLWHFYHRYQDRPRDFTNDS